MTNGRSTHEHSITQRVVQSLCRTPETRGTLYVNYTQIKNNKEVEPVSPTLASGLALFRFGPQNVVGAEASKSERRPQEARHARTCPLCALGHVRTKPRLACGLWGSTQGTDLSSPPWNSQT